MKINISQMLEGWRNNLIPPKDLKELISEVSEQRLNICKNCPFNSTQGSITNTSYCKACGCHLKAKSKCLSCTCGIVNHNESHPDNKLTVLWEAVTTPEERADIEKQIQEHDEKDQLQTGSDRSTEESI